MSGLGKARGARAKPRIRRLRFNNARFNVGPYVWLRGATLTSSTLDHTFRPTASDLVGVKSLVASLPPVEPEAVPLDTGNYFQMLDFRTFGSLRDRPFNNYGVLGYRLSIKTSIGRRAPGDEIVLIGRSVSSQLFPDPFTAYEHRFVPSQFTRSIDLFCLQARMWNDIPYPYLEEVEGEDGEVPPECGIYLSTPANPIAILSWTMSATPLTPSSRLFLALLEGR
jgi:hypothetical protein